MGIRIYGVEFICDLCGTTGQGTPVAAGAFNWAEQPRPEGWTAIEPDLSLQVTDAFGARLGHLCPSCSVLSISELAARMREQAKKTAVT